MCLGRVKSTLKNIRRVQLNVHLFVSHINENLIYFPYHSDKMKSKNLLVSVCVSACYNFSTLCPVISSV